MEYLNKDDFNTFIEAIRDKLDDTNKALLSEDFLTVLANYNNLLDTITDLTEQVSKLTADKEELLKANGKLFQKIGFDKVEEKETITDDENDDVVEVEDVIDEKGEMKDGD